MIATPDNVTHLAAGLDHPEGLCLGDDGQIFCGGEAGQVYRIDPDGSFTEIANTGGFLLGMALDGNGNLHCCDLGLNKVVRVSPSGKITERSGGAPGKDFATPNYPVFDSQGNLYVSSSGDFWDDAGTGAVMKILPDDRTELFHEGPFKFANGLAIDAHEEFLYVIQSSADNVVRVPLREPNGPIEIVWTLPQHTVADGLAFTADGSMVISCYRPDTVYLGKPDGSVEVLIEDLTAELLMRPTNCALGNGKLYLANLGGWQISVIDTEHKGMPLHHPKL